MKDFFIPTKQNNYNPLFSTRLAMVILTLWVFLLNSFSGFLIDSFGVYATDMSVDRIVQLTNEERVKRGLQSVEANAYLTSAAHAKANNMFQEQYWDHFGPNGETPWQFIKASGYDYVYAGENLGKGFSTSEGVHQAWMASPTHKENILGENYDDIGIAIVSGTLGNENVVLVVQMFGNLSKSVSGQSDRLGEPKIIQSADDEKTKSIRITYPEDETTYKDPQIPVKGEVTNFDVGSTIEIIRENTVIGKTKVEKNNSWEFKNAHDWKEGRNYIDAVITDEIEKYRDSVSFFISSTPPEILGVDVKQEGGEFHVKVSLAEKSDEASLIIGSDIIKGEISDKTAEFTVSEDEVYGKVFLTVSDIHGNYGQEDITDHFFDEETKGNLSIGGFVNFSISSIQRFVTVLLAIVILLILFAQIYFYKKVGRLEDKSGDFLMVGVWWLIFLFGSFIGYSGSIY